MSTRAAASPADVPVGTDAMVWIELAQLSAWLWRDLDEQGGRGWADRFTSAGVFDFNGSEVAGRETLREHFAKRQLAPPRVTAHLLSNVLVGPVSGEHATVSAQICVFGGDGNAPLPIALPTLIGLVEDRFERQPDGAWLVARRSFRPRFFNPDDRVGRRVAGG